MIIRHLKPRSDPESSINPWLIAVTVTIGLIFISVAIFVYCYKKRLQNPKYIATSAELASKSKWKYWLWRLVPGGKKRVLKYAAASSSGTTSYAPSMRNLTNTEMTAAEVNRNTSIRSIMTLPPYHPSPHPNERLIAREGERAGVDTVIEYPETGEEEEARREEDMEALYHIRQVRRAEIDERQERRRQRQEARDRGDFARLEELRLEAQRRTQARTATNSASQSTQSLAPETSRELIAEHHSRTASRDRRVSSVSYAELGLARHDGSRIRGGSMDDTDNHPLLNSAASISGTTTGAPAGTSSSSSSRRTSTQHFHLPLLNSLRNSRHHHHRRESSSLSISNSDLDLSMQASATMENDNGRPIPPYILETADHSTSHNTNNNERLPPSYNVALAPPEYTSPVDRDRDRDGAEAANGAMSRLPSIRITSGDLGF